jgi:hypothetical protein
MKAHTGRSKRDHEPTVGVHTPQFTPNVGEFPEALRILCWDPEWPVSPIFHGLV